MTRYEGLRVAPFRLRLAVGWAVLRGRSAVYEVIVRSGDAVWRIVRKDEG